MKAVGRAAADRRRRGRRCRLRDFAEAAMGGERGAMDLAVDEEEVVPVVHPDQAERLRAGAAVGVAVEVVADPARLGEGVGVGAMNVDDPVVIVEHARVLRLEKKEAVVEEVLIANRQRTEQGIVLLRDRRHRDRQQDKQRQQAPVHFEE